ncbi:hypothetical protein [Ramlibacter tataouinensis]|uniref:hypothetical protein n=1 Tax=Ramlibacter tataouinensis TaxID=94132 RepID=UPI00117CD5AE|nr:hypothetical protein [Ramlibacter tataouinensis]
MPDSLPFHGLLAPPASNSAALAAPPSAGFRFRPTKPQPIVALVDGSRGSVNAAWRAALIAQDWEVPLNLLRTAHATQPGSAIDDLPR